ncbi:Apolipoprotein N-acyltransferase [Acidocella aminolytica 101 = DSM 11237]|jgi:apolipoprotein N-acyltransferase|nr:apolipoprotein N-acyltransferase [Acidocella aminolytica 101 = DSM 11237]SHE37903.1 Apolipoprotein N-acyltransferase [Acidocella aminolytica 101 = DSM 11237]
MALQRHLDCPAPEKRKRLLSRLSEKLKNSPLMRAFLWGALAAAALPPVHLLPVLLFSVPALLRLTEEAPNWKRAAFIGWFYGFGLGMAGLYWITEPILTEAQTFWWLVPFAAPLLSAAVACYTVIPVLAARLVPAGLGRILVFAGAWLASNLAQQFLFTGFPWNFWGTDWAIPGVLGNIFLQPAATIGVYGLTLLTVLLSAMPLFGKRGLVILVFGVAAWGGYGYLRLQIPEQNTALKVALIQPDFQEPPDYSRPALIANWRRLLEMSHAALLNGAGAIIWPEAASPWLLASDPVARQQLAAVTGTTPVIAGSLRMVSPTDFRNSIVVTAGPQPPLATYDKWKLVPFGEYMPKWIPIKIIPSMVGRGFTPGTGPKTISNIPGVPPFGATICYEAIFTGQIINEHDRPDWIVNVTDDAWFGNTAGPRQHFADARLRAVEEGLPLVRNANSGISAVIDPFGRVVASMPLNYQGVLVANLPNPQPVTVYARWGLRIPFMLALTFVLLGLIYGNTRRLSNK